MNQSLKITSYIIEILKQNTELIDFVGDKIFPIDAKLGTDFPFIVINRNSIQPQYSKDGNSCDIITVAIAIADPIYAKAVDIATLVRESLEFKKFRIDDVVIKDIRITYCSESIQNDCVVQEIQFEIKI